MASSSDSIFGITTTILTIPVGATVSFLLTPSPYCQAMTLKYVSGGSVSIFGVQNGVTLAGADLVAGYSGAYTVGTTESVSLGGPARFYISATGSTALVSLLQGLSSNLSSFY